MNSPVKVWRNQKKTRDLVGKKGTVISWTVVRVPPAGFSDQAPYIVALVKFGTGKHSMIQLVDVSDVSLLTVGFPVKTVIRRVTSPSHEGIIPYGIKATPL